MLWAAVFFPLLTLYLMTLRLDPLTMSPDTISVTGSAWQLAHHGTPRLPATTAALPDWLIPSGQGHLVSNRAPGLILLAAPFYALMPWAEITNVGPASLAAALVTAAAMGFMALVFRRLASASTALVGALIAGTATTTWAVSGTSLWPHSANQLYLTLAVLAMASAAPARAGLAFAAAALTRPPLAVVAAVMGLWDGARRRSIRPTVVIGAVTSVGLAVFLWYSRSFWHGGLQSQYTATQTGEGFSDHFVDVGIDGWKRFGVGLIGTLISPGRGILPGSPMLAVVILGIPSAWRAAPHWAKSAAIGGVVYMAIQLKANRFGGGSSFWSYRYPLEMLTLAAPLLVLAWQRWVAVDPRRRAWFWTLTVVSITLQAIGATSFRHKGTFWWGPTDLHYAFVDHPRLAVPIALIGYVAAATIFRRVNSARSEADLRLHALRREASS